MINGQPKWRKVKKETTKNTEQESKVFFNSCRVGRMLTFYAGDDEAKPV